VLRQQKQEVKKVQSSLHSLKGVVVVEDLVRAKKLLKDSEVEEEKKVRVLRQLGEKRPSTELLESTGIGRTVKKLSREGEGEVRSAASKVYRSWKDTVERRVELSHTKIEVRCDKETESRRSSAVRLVTTALTRSLDCSAQRREELAREVEKEVFTACNNLVGSRYRKLTRKVVFGLRGDSETRDQLVVGGEKAASKIVKIYLRDS